MEIGYLRGFILRLLGRKRSQALPQPDLRVLSERLNYSFQDEKLLFQALKHRSYLSYSGEERIQSNERLELLGDAVLGLIVTEYLFKKFPEKEEGTLTNLKSLLVNRQNLSKVAKRFELGDFILLNDAEEKAGGRHRESILSDAVEAIIGAVYLDGGLTAAERLIHENITFYLQDILEEGNLKNYKSILLEYCQSIGLDGPHYRVEKESGPDHKKIFTVAVYVDDEKMGTGEGSSKKHAEQEAAKNALTRLDLI